MSGPSSVHTSDQLLLILLASRPEFGCRVGTNILWLRSNQPKRCGVQSTRFKQFALLITILKDS